MNDAERIPMILAKLENVEGALARVERLIEKEVAELKTEQTKAIDRLGDDQRRLWEAVRSLELDRSSNHGKGRVLSGLIYRFHFYCEQQRGCGLHHKIHEMNDETNGDHEA